jgi:transcriptional regulator with XRE-family HTH domain
MAENTMTGNELKRRREALGLSVEQIAARLGCQTQEIKVWESWDKGEIYFGYPQMLELALDRLDSLNDQAKSDAEIEEVLSKTAVEIATTDPNEEQTLIAEARKTIETLQQAIANANKQNVLPHTVRLLSERKQGLQDALGDRDETAES